MVEPLLSTVDVGSKLSLFRPTSHRFYYLVCVHWAWYNEVVSSLGCFRNITYIFTSSMIHTKHKTRTKHRANFVRQKWRSAESNKSKVELNEQWTTPRLLYSNPSCPQQSGLQSMSHQSLRSGDHTMDSGSTLGTFSSPGESLETLYQRETTTRTPWAPHSAHRATSAHSGT